MKAWRWGNANANAGSQAAADAAAATEQTRVEGGGAPPRVAMGIVNVQVDPAMAAANPAMANRLQIAQIAQHLINTHGVARDQVRKSRAPPRALSREISLLGVRWFRP